MSETIYKQAEKRIREWLNRPEEGYYFYRLPDQTFGISGPSGCNPCDFFLFKSPDFYMIESKATLHDRFDFSLITDYQEESMLSASKISNVHGYVIILYITYQRAFMLDINDIVELKSSGIKSLNIKKLSKWPIKYKEIRTIPSRKQLLEYDKGDTIVGSFE